MQYLKKICALRKSQVGTWGVAGVDIYDEARAKMWVASNINCVRSTYRYDTGLKVSESDGRNAVYTDIFTSYGYIKTLPSLEEVKDFLIQDHVQSIVVSTG